jgi:uncharacterized protein (TIRG00374 family)
MSASAKKWLKFAVRWGIAVFGIWWVLSNLSWHDRVMIASPIDGWPVSLRLARPATEDASSFSVYMPDGGTNTLTRADLLARADPVRLTVVESGRRESYDQLARKVVPGARRETWPILATQPRNIWARFWNLHTGAVKLINPADVVAPRDFAAVPYPVIDPGLGPMIRNANRSLLLLALGVFPLVYFITAWRWHALLSALGIEIPLRRAFVLNMVGAFYNTFMPGSTGGDLLKAYYIARQTKLRTRAVMSVIVDRIIGLLALVMMGGLIAAFQYDRLTPGDPARTWCARVAVGAMLILTATVLGLSVYYTPILRRLIGLDFVIRRLPMQTQVNKAVETMEIYRQRSGLIVWAILITLPVHATVVLSAMFAGMAFGLPLHWSYYWVVVPVVVLSGAIPISPQGAGVMEFFAVMLTRRHGVSVGGAFALTMSIRVVQMLWNLTGGIFVIRGGYQAPTEQEARTLESDSAEGVLDAGGVTAPAESAEHPVMKATPDAAAD